MCASITAGCRTGYAFWCRNYTDVDAMRVGVLFSGGKDSLYACWKAMQKEEVVCLVTVISKNEESYMFHTPNISLAALQAEAAGLPLLEVETAGQKEEELDDLRLALTRAKERFGIEGVVTGAILSVYQATRIQRICFELGLWCFNPLWYADQEAYMEELLASGFRVVIAGVFSYPFEASWLGREIDQRTLEELRKIASKHRITLTGEGGELETFVLDAPFFSRRIEIEQASTTYSNYHGVYRIEQARLVEK
jgi:diphthine-ammonia ligase